MTSIPLPRGVRRTVALALFSALVPTGALLAQAPQSTLHTPRTPAQESLAYDERVSSIQIYVAPENPSWTYRLGEPVRFKVTATADKQPLSGTVLRYRVGPEMLPALEQTATLPTDGTALLIDGGTLDEPGFVRCEVTVTVDAREYRGVGTAGFSPENILPTQSCPDDFDAFWSAALEELAKVPLDPELTLLPELSTSKVDVYHLSLRTAESSSRVYGILCVPKGKGPYPAILEVPGAGIRAYKGLVTLAEKGVITLQIGINGIPVNLPDEVYEQLGNGALAWASGGYPNLNLDDRDHYYYRRVYLSCIRANDFLVSHTKFDGQNLLVMGVSQGGQLSIVTAALDPRVKALAAAFPAYCDVTGYLHGRAGGWPHMMRPEEEGRPSRHATEAKIRTTAYYDAVNFARRLKVPGHYTWGYNDTVCPPTTMYAAYNVITAPKKLLVALETGHGMSPEQQVRIDAWVAEQLGLGK